MNKSDLHIKRSPQRWPGMVLLLLGLFVLLVAGAAGAGAETAVIDNVQPHLLALAAEQPDATVRVIVQKTAPEAALENAVSALDGTVLKDLNIINALVAELPAGSVADLARTNGVRWVSMDGAVESAGKPPQDDGTTTTGGGVELLTLSDEFFIESYDSNNGDKPWASPWVEDDPTGQGPLGGSIYIADGELRLQDSPDSGTMPSIYREVDLSHAIGEEASLFFVFNFGPGVQSGQDSIALEVSADGGQSYKQLIRFSSYDGGISGTFGGTLADYISSHTRIRFRVLSGYDAPDAYFALEAIQVGYNANPLSEGVAYNTYLDTLNVPQVWAKDIVGDRVGVVVVDSGVNKESDFGRRILKAMSLNPNSTTVNDVNGHGTHVAGIVGGTGEAANGRFAGIAPEVDIYSLKISDETGMAYESDLVDAMEWILDYKDRYNLRVVNLSLNSAVEGSYHNNPVNAAVEILWFNGIVVVASAGNSGDNPNFNAINTAPANDPFIITVGASHEQQTSDRTDDVVASFSAYGTTIDGFKKPEIIAPGKDIISVLSAQSSWDAEHANRVVHEDYFRISGTSMSAPMVTGAVALLLQAEPDLTPDQVKYRLMQTGSSIAGVDSDPNVYPYLDVYAAITTPTIESANQDAVPHMLLAKMALIAYWANENGDETIDWSTVDWDAVNWDAVDWDAVDWNSVNWASVNWASVNWASVNWASVNWASVNWASVNWGSVNWGSVNWGSVNWGSVSWEN